MKTVNRSYLLTGRLWLDIVLGLVLGVLSYPLYFFLFGTAIVRVVHVRNANIISILILSISLSPNFIIYRFARNLYPVFILVFAISGIILSLLLYILFVFGILVGPPPEIHG